MRVCINASVQAPRGSGGYLLLEVVLAMGIAATLLISIFMIASGSLSLSETIVEEGRTEGRQESFLSFLERSFAELPGNAEFRLSSTESSQRLLPTLTIQNAPTSFAFEGLPIAAEAVVIRTAPVPGGGINVLLEYYESKILDDSDGLAVENVEPVGTIILYRDIWRFELRALQINTMEFVSEWEASGRWPVQIELNAIFQPDGEEVVHHFWLPAKANPAQLLRSGQQQGRQGGERGQPTTPTPDGGEATPGSPSLEGRPGARRSGGEQP